MRGDQTRVGAKCEAATPVSEDFATLIVVAMLTSMTMVLSGAASIASSGLSLLI